MLGYEPMKGVDFVDGKRGKQGVQGPKGDQGIPGKDGTVGWIHVSYKEFNNRKEVLRMTIKNGKSTYTKYQ